MCQLSRRGGLVRRVGNPYSARVATNSRDPDRNVRTVVKMLMAANNVDPAGLAVALGVARNTVYLRLSGERRFTIADLDRLAEYFEVDAGLFFSDPKELFADRRPLAPRRISSRAGSGARAASDPSTVNGDTVGYRACAGQGAREVGLPVAVGL